MILESCAASSTCNSPLVHSAAHLPMETMAKLPPLNGISFQANLNVAPQTTPSPSPDKWRQFKPPRIAIAVYNFQPNRRSTNTIKSRSSSSSSWPPHSLQLTVGDVLIIVEHFGAHWFRGYVEGSAATKLGIFPSSYVQLFDHHNYHQISADSPEVHSYTSYYYSLFDPLYLQTVRTLREWHGHLQAFYRSNTNVEKYQAVRKLMSELLEICRGPIGKELAPTLWRRRCNQILKGTNGTFKQKDPFVKLYLDEDENPSPESDNSKSVLEPSLEELYDKIISKLNYGNQLLNLEIMPSFTHGTFSSDNTSTYLTLIRNNELMFKHCDWMQSWGANRSKFQPYFARENSKYLTSIFEYYNRLNQKFALRYKSPSQSHRTSSFHSPLHNAAQNGRQSTTTSLSNSSQVSVSNKKHRRHLLLTIREVNFASLFSNSEADQQSPLLQIDVHVLRCNNSNGSSDCAYQVLTEKFCYRVRASGQPLLTHSKCQSWNAQNLNRALFLDVVEKQEKKSTSSIANSGNSFSSQHSDSANCYLVIQVWRYGKMLLNESRTKNMLSATMSSASASLSSGTSVFHTISSSSLSATTAAAAASTTSLTSLTSFVSNSTLFGADKSTASSTPDSSSIDSTEFGTAGSFKRSVGFAVVPLLELVSRDQELKSNADLLRDESVISRVLLADESVLLPVPIKLYEGDLTTTALETMLKHRQQSASISTNTLAFSSAPNSTVSSTASISKLSQLTSNYQLILSAKFISELLVSASNSNLPPSNISSKISLGSLSNDQEVHSSTPSTSLADWLLLSQCSMGTLSGHHKDHSTSARSLNFVVVQKRFFGELITAGHFRNDFYLTLEGAEFEKGGKAIPKNIEVSICLITENGIQERALSSGANDEPVTFYRSHIQYHQNSPKWYEHVKINVPLELFESAHLRFTFCHCSSKERERKFVGFSFLPLAQQNGACLSDGEHELFIYKCDNERKLDEVSYYLNVPWGTNEKTAAVSGHSSSSSSIASSAASSSSTSLAATSSLINSRSSKEVFHIRTNLVSSKLTQNSDILSLLKWSCTPLEQVYDALARIGRVPGEEIVKFLEDVMDALFTLFTNTSGSLESLPQMTIIFRVLVDFFKTLNDPKFASYRTALETYIENQFSAPLVHPGLMACVKKYIELVIISFQTDANGSPPSLSGVTKRELEFILRCLSVFDWMLKIIVQSRILYTQASANGMLLEGASSENIQSCEDFRLEIFSLFQSINRLLSVESKSSDDYLIIAIQESVLSTLPNAFNYLTKVLSPLELSKLVKSIVNSSKTNEWSPLSSLSATPTNSNQSSSGKKTIVSAKLSLLQETIRCKQVWSNEEARLELLDTFIRLLNVSIAESKNCLAILHDVVFYLIDNSPANCKVKMGSAQGFAVRHTCQREIEMLSFGAFDAIVEHIIELTGVVYSGSSLDLLPFNSSFKRSHSARTEEDHDYLGSYILCFTILLDFMSFSHYERLFETRSTRQCKELIIHIFMVFLNALYYFNDTWLEIKMAVNRTILQSLQSLRIIMSQEFLGPDKFDITLWRTYFKLSIAFLTQQRLQLDAAQMPYWKRRFILDTYGGDLRIIMGNELVSTWNSIGSSKIEFIPSMVSSFVEVTLVPELELRQSTLPIFFDMLSVDYEANGHFKQTESALIDKLDALSHKPECDIQYRELFTKIMTHQIEQRKPVWYLDGHALVKSVSRLLLLLIDYRHELKSKQIPSSKQSVNEVDDSLLICTYTLLRFFRDEIDSYNRKTIMLRYVDKLANLHILLGHFSEAAFTLKLHADQLSWCPNECTRKESLCETILSYFERGQCWEEGLKVCKDLQSIYEQNYKFAKLSTILKRNAELLDKILNQHRPECEYFRVSFYGLDFPSFLQNSTFIFRGREFEKISDFTHRIQQEFPKAQLLTKSIPSDESITESHSQYIQIFVVKPIAQPPVSPDQSLIFGPPDNVLAFYQSNFVRQFIQDRPIQRAPFDPNNEFKSLWIERTMYTTEKPLPGILRMFQVVTTQVTYLSPIENACETIENMNNELSKLIGAYSNEQTRPEAISPLSMRLQGILEAAVNGGIAKYIEAFLGSEFLSNHPDQVTHVTLLKNRIAHQIKIVESGLTLHGRLAPTPVRPLHTRLLERFGTMRNTVNQANIEISQALLWTPNQSTQVSSANRPSILSQPLPPIPSILQRHDASSDPETSSLSSSSSTHNNTASHEHPVKCTPSHQPPPPPPASLAFLSQSPNGKTLKKKPLPPLPPGDMPVVNGGHSMAVTSAQPHQRHHSTSFEHSNLFRSKSKQNLPIDDSIYAVPQLPDVNGACSNGLDQGSSVDDDCSDYYDEECTPPAHSSNGQHHSQTVPRGIYRSRSIPRSSISPYNGNCGMICQEAPLLPPLQRGLSNQNLNELEDELDSAPPPLPPRTVALDRSNSLNSGVRSSSLIPPLIPPALPQRRVRKSSSTSNSSYPSSAATVISNSTSIFSSPSKATISEPDSTYLSNLDGIEFENLVISSPTPRSESSHQSNRPAPIIGIEIGNDMESDLFPATPLITDSISTFVEPGKIQEHRSKSSSLPRMQQFALNFESLSTSNSNSTETNTVMEHFESKIVSSMTTTAAAVVATNGAASLHHHHNPSTADTTRETKSSLLD